MSGCLDGILAGCSFYILHHPKQGQISYTIMYSAFMGILMIHLFLIYKYTFETILHVFFLIK